MIYWTEVHRAVGHVATLVVPIVWTPVIIPVEVVQVLHAVLNALPIVLTTVIILQGVVQVPHAVLNALPIVLTAVIILQEGAPDLPVLQVVARDVLKIVRMIVIKAALPTADPDVLLLARRDVAVVVIGLVGVHATSNVR